MSSQWSFSFSTGGAGRKETISDMNSGANAAGRSSSITTHEITLPKGNISEVSPSSVRFRNGGGATSV